MLRNILLGLFLLVSGINTVFASDYEPMRMDCGPEKYTIYWGASGYAVTRGTELLTNPVFMRKTYGNDLDAILLTVEHWGRNGGLHYLKTFVFSSDKKSISLSSQYLDADNSPRAKPEMYKCTGNVNAEIFIPEY